MTRAWLNRGNSLAAGVLGRVSVILVGLALGVAASACAAESDSLAPEMVFAAQAVSPRPIRLLPISAEGELRPPAATAIPSPGALPELDAGELFPAESFAEAGDLPTCSTVASLAERLLGTCLRQGLSESERALTERLLSSAAQPNRTDAWSRDTESLFRLAQCAGSLTEQRVVATAALATAEAELQSSTTASGVPFSECRREHAQRARWLWTYRLAALDIAQGHYLRAAATLLHLHRTAPTKSLVSRLAIVRQNLLRPSPAVAH